MFNQKGIDLDSEQYVGKARDLRSQTTKGDFEQWLHNPLTRALLYDLKAGIAESCIVWASGGYPTQEDSAAGQSKVEAYHLVGQLIHAHPSVDADDADDFEEWRGNY